MPIADLSTLINATAQNLSQFKGLSVAYNLLGGAPTIAGYTALIEENNDSNFGAGPGTTFNDENVYINVLNALYQGNADAKTAFDAIVGGGASLSDKLELVYNSLIPAAERTDAGLAYFKSQAAFYEGRAAELGVEGPNGAALVAYAALAKIAVDNDIGGLGDTIIDLVAAVNNGTAALPEDGTDFTPLETADGTDFDTDDVVTDPTVGTTFTLTTGVDTFTGGALDDTFIAGTVKSLDGSTDVPTLSAADTLRGGNGNDQLNITVNGTGDALGGADIAGIETANVRNVAATGGGTATVDASVAPGLMNVWSDRSTGDLSVTKLAEGGAIGIRGNGSVQSGDVAFGYSDEAFAATILFDGGTKAGKATVNPANEDQNAVTVSFNNGTTALGTTSATIISQGAANSVNNIDLNADAGPATVKSLTIDAATNFTVAGADIGPDADADPNTWISGFAADATIDVNGAGKVSVGSLEGNVKEVNGADNTGGVTVTGGFDATDKFVGGKGDDTLTAGVALTSGSADAGEGTGDRLKITNDAAVDTASKGGKFMNFEILRTADTGGSTFNLANIAGITMLEIDGAGGTTIDGFNSQTVTVIGDNVGGLTLNKTGALPAGADVVDIKIDNSVLENADGVDVGTINVLNIDTLNLESVGGKLSPATESNSAGIGTNADLETVNLKGDTAFDLTTSGSTVDSVNAADFTATLKVDASGNSGAIEIIGGSGKNTLFGSSNDDVLKGGAAKDTIRGNAGADVITGGGEVDTFDINNYIAPVTTGNLQASTIAANVNIDQELIDLTADTTNDNGERINISYTLNGVVGQIDGIIDVLGGGDINVANQAALATFVAAQLNGVNGITAATNANPGQVEATAGNNGSLTINSVTFNTQIEAAAAVVSNGADDAQITTITIDNDPVVGETYSFDITIAGGTATTISATAASTDPQALVTLLIADVNTKLGTAVTAADVIAPNVTQFTITDDVPDNGGFNISNIVIGGGSTGGYGGDSNAVISGVGPTLAVSGYDSITDFNTGGSDVLQFVAADEVAGAAAAAPVSGTSVQISADGKVTFAATDDTLAEKVFTLAADDTNVADNEVVFFEHGANTYVYGAGVSTTNADADFLVELVGVTGLTELSESATTAGNFTLA